MFDELKEHTFPQEDQNTQEPEQTEEVAQAAPQESQKEQNLRYLRERAEAAERRYQDLERSVHMNASQQKNAQVQVEEEEEMDISDDTYVEGKQLKKYIRDLKKDIKNTKKQFEETNYRNVMTNAELRLKSQFNDFDTVVNTDNLNKLKSLKPSLYRSIMSNQDIYDQGYSAYDIIKSSGISNNDYEREDRKIQENRAKPRSSGSVAPQSGETSALSRIGDYGRRVLTEEYKDQLRRQVAEAKSRKA